jgi:hypothetical protein
VPSEAHVITKHVPYEGTLDVRDGIISFSVPDDATAEERSIVPEIVRYDHKAKQQLGYENKMWKEVHSLLLNTVILLQQRDITGAKALLKIAIDTYHTHNQVFNRMWYLGGTLVGIFAAALFGMMLFLVSGISGTIGTKLLLMIVVFAGIGSTTSVLTRLNTIDLTQETSRFLVFMSGCSKPIVATAFAVVIFFIVKLKVVGITIGTASETDPDSLYVITSFLSGFSERFAADIISRTSVSRISSSPDNFHS